MSKSESTPESRVKAVLNDDLLAVLAPVLDWYQSDEHPDREPLDILRDIVTDLQSDRADSIALGKVRAAIGEIVCTGGEDAGVVYLSNEAPTDWDEKLGCAVYRHECFSPLGDALVALHRLSSANISSKV